VDLGKSYTVLFLILTGFLLLPSVSAEWWDDDWSFKKPVEVTERSNTSLSNYSVELEVDTASLISSGKMESDCSDLRFANKWENDTVEHWVQSGCDTGSTDVYLEVPSIGPNESETLYMYYGNSGASSTSELTIGSSNDAAESCEQVYRKMENAPNRNFNVDPDSDGSNLQEVRCDMGVNDTGWTLLYNYDHLGGTNPDVTEGTWPSDHSALSHQDKISDFGYSQSIIDSMRLRCETSNHNRIVHYVTKDDEAITGILDNQSTTGYQAISNDAYKLPGHSANLPDAASSDTGGTESSVALFGPGFPMYEGGQHHWTIGEPNRGGNRWECDDYPDGPSHDTLHQIWFKSDTDAPLLNRTPNYEIGQQTRQKKLVDRRTYLGNKPRTFFAENQTVHLEVEGGYAEIPSITVFDPNGSEIFSEQMENNSGTFEYDYSVNGTEGWYRVEIGNFNWEKAFYRGEVWNGNFTDGSGNRYTFRRELNVSEPGTQDRWNYPVDRHVEFNFDPVKESVRVVSWNGSRMLEIPSQLYNTSGSLDSSNVVFLSGLEQSEKRTYYVVSAKENYSKNYSGLETEGKVSVENSFYNASFSESRGGLLSRAIDFLGRSQEVQGTEPLDYYPELDIGLSTYSARVDSTSEIEVTEGTLMTEITTSGNLNDLDRLPYSVDCRAYARNSYMICEKNLTAGASDTWDSLIFNGLIFEDDRFRRASYENSSQIVDDELSAGSGNSFSFQDPRWISFYNDNSGDAVAEIFLEEDFAAGSPSFTVEDSSSYDYFTQNVINSGKDVSEGDYFYTKTARSIYNGLKGTEKPENLYDSLTNPPSVTEGEETTNDDSKPFYTSSGNVSTNSSSEVKVFSRWKDDTFLQDYSVNISGRGGNGANTTLFTNESDIRDSGFTNSSWVNVTLNSSEINSGRIYANITVSDVAGKENTSFFSFNVSDTTPPEISDIRTSPSSNSSVDPEKEIEVSANLTEYSSISDVNLYYRNGSTENFTEKQMTEVSGSNFEKVYNTSITPQVSDTYTYFIEAEDSKGNSVNSSEKKLYALWDYTWSSDFKFSNRSATFDTNTSTGNLTINNTGDFDLTFEFSTGVFNSRTWVNGTQLEESLTVENGSSELFRINSTTREGGLTEGVDTFNLTLTSSQASPQSRFKVYELTTSTGGPFLFTEFTQYNSSITLGTSDLDLEAEIINKGSERAEDVNLTFEIPSGWSTEDSKTSPTSLGLDVGNSYGHNIVFDVPNSSSTGTYQVNATARSVNETETAPVDIKVESGSETIVEESGGSGGGGGGAAQDDSGLSQEQQERLFQTEETYSIVRGENQSFTLEAENPFEEGDLEDVELEINGFLQQYLSVEPESIEEIPVNKSKNFMINIEAPDYFSRGEYQLNMTITGINNLSRTVNSGEDALLVRDVREMRENRLVNLVVHEVSRERAESSLERSSNLTERLEEQRVLSAELNDTLQQINESIEEGNYQQAYQLSQQVEQSYSNAANARRTIDNVTELIDEAEYRGLDTPRTSRTLELAEAALERGDYSLAVERSDEARSLFTIETQGKTNYINLIQRKWKQISLALIFISLTGFTGLRQGKISLIERKIQGLESERESIRERMEEIQERCFVEETMSMKEYQAGMEQYREQLYENINREVTLESKKLYWIKMMRSRPALKEKREKLKSLIKQAQHRYFEEDTISKTMYETKIERYRAEFAEVEEELAEIEIRKRTGIRGKINGLLS
jgi:uncharacterized membrane protein/HEPN domain-containing protein